MKTERKLLLLSIYTDLLAVFFNVNRKPKRQHITRIVANRLMDRIVCVANDASFYVKLSLLSFFKRT